MSVDVPDELDWWVWRLLTSDRLTVTLAELRDDWTYVDACQAHLALDLWDDLESAKASAMTPEE